MKSSSSVLTAVYVIFAVVPVVLVLVTLSQSLAVLSLTTHGIYKHKVEVGRKLIKVTDFTQTSSSSSSSSPSLSSDVIWLQWRRARPPAVLLLY